MRGSVADYRVELREAPWVHDSARTFETAFRKVIRLAEAYTTEAGDSLQICVWSSNGADDTLWSARRNYRGRVLVENLGRQ